MKSIIRSLALLFPLLALPCFMQAQNVNNLYMAGMSYNSNGSPNVAGTALYAHQINTVGTYAFSVYDAMPNTIKPLTVTSNIGVGIAQKVLTIDGHDVFMPTSAGISYTGTNTGWSWSAGAGVPFKLKPTKDGGSWYIMPIVRVVKSSVANGTGYQPIVSLTFGYGK